ncbi:DUF3597 domain-containing protein [Sphingobium boeckii]|uniref:DUF3597 domain-containing protein n=1 Tax=Sphingobium boeckii TaxID=1082345 RepID=A0A7W9AF37_9SPHN|nr:DUF3597 domain-containing protein [Sphingobium boeckii]MBB5684517.1 hypothetical protein [Sphingobium boeckii]
MSIFGKIKDAIFGKKPEPVTQTAAPAAIPQIATPAPSAPVDLPPVDVEAVLSEKAAGKDLNWRTSIVDLMKLLDLDSSLENRKELATELGYTGDKNDSATMNIWLHKQVMSELAHNGGVVPADLKD